MRKRAAMVATPSPPPQKLSSKSRPSQRRKTTPNIYSSEQKTSETSHWCGTKQCRERSSTSPFPQRSNRIASESQTKTHSRCIGRSIQRRGNGGRGGKGATSPPLRMENRFRTQTPASLPSSVGYGRCRGIDRGSPDLRCLTPETLSPLFALTPQIAWWFLY